MIELTLPWPPSVNHYWRHVFRGPRAGQTYISEAGEAFRTAVLGYALEYGLRGRIAGRLRVTVELFPPDRRTRDIDNGLKGLLDSLKHAGVIRDDADVYGLSVTKHEPAPPGRAVVAIAGYDA